MPLTIGILEFRYFNHKLFYQFIDTCIWIHIFDACKDTFSLSSILLFQSTCIINSFFYIAVLNYFTDFALMSFRIGIV